MPTHIADLPLMPKIRSYILPDKKGHVIGRRDYSQQELRVLAHFEDGALLQAYLNDPQLDVHEFLRLQILETLGMDVDRTTAKNLNFGFVYGMGLGSLAATMDKSVEEVKKFRDAQMRVLPGLKELSRSITNRAKSGNPIRTWGGREYYAEPPAFSKKFNKMMTFEYKLLNYAVQASSADITKEALIRYDSARKDGRFLLSVYDEIDISVPKGALKPEMLLLRECMMSIELDVPLMSDGEWGPNLGELSDLAEPNPNLSRWGITKW
jgi:DNA polymerase theta